MDVTQKIKLQRAVPPIPPNGIPYDKTNRRFGTAHLSYLFTLLSTFPKEESVLVAGPGIEPGSGGYEPPEVPLLYPAMLFNFTSLERESWPLLILTGSVHLVSISFRTSRNTWQGLAQVSHTCSPRYVFALTHLPCLTLL